MYVLVCQKEKKKCQYKFYQGTHKLSKHWGGIHRSSGGDGSGDGGDGGGDYSAYLSFFSFSPGKNATIPFQVPIAISDINFSCRLHLIKGIFWAVIRYIS